MAHTHHCKVCNEAVAVCDGDACVQEQDHYCSRHHPDKAFRVEDKEVPKMTVKVAPPDADAT